MLVGDTNYISKAELIRKIVEAWRGSDLDFSGWSSEDLERLANVTIEALNRASERKV